jgi:hypothetical protein
MFAIALYTSRDPWSIPECETMLTQNPKTEAVQYTFKMTRKEIPPETSIKCIAHASSLRKLASVYDFNLLTVGVTWNQPLQTSPFKIKVYNARTDEELTPSIQTERNFVISSEIAGVQVPVDEDLIIEVTNSSRVQQTLGMSGDIRGHFK